MLNETEVLRHIERETGFMFTDLELDEQEILDTINKYTIPVFSKFHPHQERIRVTDKDRVEGYQNIFYMDTENEIININRVVGQSFNMNGAMYLGTPHPSANLNYGGNPIESQMMADLNATVSPRTYRFHHPNKIELLPGYLLGGQGVLVVANTYHEKHYGTIPNNMQEYFLELATYDVQMSLYRLRSRFQNLQTTFGSMELFLDELQEARSNRRELIQLMEERSLFNSDRKKLFFG